MVVKIKLLVCLHFRKQNDLNELENIDCLYKQILLLLNYNNQVKF